MIELAGVCKRYGHGAIVALDEVDFALAEGEIAVATGPSGAGKTTLLRMIAAAEAPDAGTVRLFGHDARRLRRSSLPHLRRQIGVVPQDLQLLADRTALENVALALEVRALPRREIQARAAAALADVGLAQRVDASTGALSVGEQQRVAVARALVAEPAIVLADEPTSALDPACAAIVLAVMISLAERGAAILVTTNDRDVLDAAARRGWRRIALEGGRLRTLAAAAPAQPGNVVPFPAVAQGGKLE
jgi:cell division transport system ATP-binding protein